MKSESGLQSLFYLFCCKEEKAAEKTIKNKPMQHLPRIQHATFCFAFTALKTFCQYLSTE